MEINYYFAMNNIDSKAIEKIAGEIYGTEFRIFLGENGKVKPVTMQELEQMNLRGHKITLENCDKTEEIKPAYVSIIQLEDRQSYVEYPKYSLEIAAKGEVLEKARKTIEAILQS